MVRIWIVVPLFIFLALVLGACGRDNSGALIDDTPLSEAELSAATQVAPIPTFTPTPEPPPVEVPPLDTNGEAASGTDTSNPDESGLTTVELAADATGADNPDLDGMQAAAVDAEEAENQLDLGALLAPTPTPPPAPAAQVSVAGINVRAGPGTAYAQVGAATQGDLLTVIGRNIEGDWWQVCCFNEQPGWVYGPLVETRHTEEVAVASEIPPLPEIETAAPVALAPEPQPPVDTPAAETPADSSAVETEPAVESVPVAEAVAEEPAPAPPAAAPPGQPAPTSGTAGNFDPNAQYQIVHYRVRGIDDNNGGIYNSGAQHMIFVTVLDEAGNGVNGAVLKNALADDVTITTGDKGPGKTEMRIYWDPLKLYVAQDGSGPVTSQVSNQMNLPYPHIPDIVGLMGPLELEYSVCPTIEVRCEPPFFHAHWSYEITFQKVR